MDLLKNGWSFSNIVRPWLSRQKQFWIRHFLESHHQMQKTCDYHDVRLCRWARIVIGVKVRLVDSPSGTLTRYYFLVRYGIQKAARDFKAQKIYYDSKSKSKIHIMSRHSSKLETTDGSTHNWLSVRAEMKTQFNYILTANMRTGNVTKIYNSEGKVAISKHIEKNGTTYCPY